MNYETFIKQLINDSNNKIDYYRNKELEETLELYHQQISRVNKLSEKKQLEKIKPFSIRELLKNRKDNIKLKPKETALKQNPGLDHIDVIIPTYRENDFLDVAVKSIENQKELSINTHIIIAVNGDDINYYQKLKNYYNGKKHIQVLYTKIKGVAAARNLGIKHSTGKYIFFLDDDDYLTEKYLFVLMKNIKPFCVACGKMQNQAQDGKIKIDTYINNGLYQIQNNGGSTKKTTKGIFSTVTAKLFPGELLRKKITPFVEDIQYTTDILFWADNYNLFKNKMEIVDLSYEEYYTRVLSENSITRPKNNFEFYINGRLKIINELEKRLLKTYDLDWKNFLLRLIKTQNNIMYNAYLSMGKTEQKNALKYIYSYNGIFVEKGRFSTKKGISFCYNFPPAQDTSAYVAVKRLSEIENLERTEAINWTAIGKDTSDRLKNDSLFYKYYTRFICNNTIYIGGKTNLLPEDYFQFAILAYNRSKEISADVIYSRSMAPASHLAAYLYKINNPNTTWYAEFSDPIAINSNLQKRKNRSLKNSNFEHSENFFEYCELAVYEKADHIIFTNENQKEYMLNYSNNTSNNNILKKCIVSPHPVLKQSYIKLFKSKYKLDKNKINIGYFGHFYKNQTLDDLLVLQKNKNVSIHIFTLNASKYKHLSNEQLHIHEQLPYFKFVELASRMDYVFLNDMQNEQNINIWLPSKYSDYVASGTNIIAKIVPGSPLSKKDNPLLIKIEKITEKFALNLKKEK